MSHCASVKGASCGRAFQKGEEEEPLHRFFGPGRLSPCPAASHCCATWAGSCCLLILCPGLGSRLAPPFPRALWSAAWPSVCQLGRCHHSGVSLISVSHYRDFISNRHARWKDRPRSSTWPQRRWTAEPILWPSETAASHPDFRISPSACSVFPPAGATCTTWPCSCSMFLSVHTASQVALYGQGTRLPTQGQGLILSRRSPEESRPPLRSSIPALESHRQRAWWPLSTVELSRDAIEETHPTT